MSHCVNCRHEFETGKRIPEICPKCGTNLSDAGNEQQWTAVARVTNLAEVGYFADLLHARDIATDIHQHNEFSASDGSWSMTFILRVPRHAAADAASALKLDLRSGGTGPLATVGYDEPPLQRRSAMGALKPFVFLLMAGGMVYCAGRGLSVRAPKPVRSGDQLWRSLSESAEPLQTQSPPGEPFRRLRFDPLSKRFLLEEDFDGDGKVDLQREFVAP